MKSAARLGYPTMYGRYWDGFEKDEQEKLTAAFFEGDIDDTLRQAVKA